MAELEAVHEAHTRQMSCMVPQKTDFKAKFSYYCFIWGGGALSEGKIKVKEKRCKAGKEGEQIQVSMLPSCPQLPPKHSWSPRTFLRRGLGGWGNALWNTGN